MLLEKPSQHETLYGLINGLTSAARNMAPDERYTLETQAGGLLEDGLKTLGFGFGGGGFHSPPSSAEQQQQNGRIALIARNGESVSPQPVQNGQVGLFGKTASFPPAPISLLIGSRRATSGKRKKTFENLDGSIRWIV